MHLVYLKNSETGKGDEGKKEIKQDKEEHITMRIGIFWKGAFFTENIYPCPTEKLRSFQ